MQIAKDVDVAVDPRPTKVRRPEILKLVALRAVTPAAVANGVLDGARADAHTKLTNQSKLGASFVHPSRLT